jgi:hypothetical protein
MRGSNTRVTRDLENGKAAFPARFSPADRLSRPKADQGASDGTKNGDESSSASLLREDQPGAMNKLALMIDELYIASHSDNQGRRNITCRNICALNFFAKKLGASGVCRYRQLPYQRE